MCRIIFGLCLTIFFAACSNENVYSGCGFSISIGNDVHVKKHVAFESLSYDFYDESNNVIFWLVLKNEAFTGLFSEKELNGNLNELTSDFTLLFSHDNIFYGLDTLQDQKFVSEIYGSRLNSFPIYAQFFYKEPLEGDERIMSIKKSIKAIKDTATSERCR